MAQWVQTLADNSIKEHVSPRSLDSCSIFRAPISMRPHDKNQKNDFDPELVSVGPFHYKSPALQHMEAHKLRFLSHLLGDQSREERELTLQSLAQAMQVMEQETRACYSETFDHISSEDFVRMMVVDGCFVLQLLCFYQNDEKDDPIFRTKWMVPALRMDLTRLENQVPIKVLQRLLLLIRPQSAQDLFTSLALSLFAPLIPQEQHITLAYQEPRGRGDEPKHLLALFYSTLMPESPFSLDVRDARHTSPETDTGSSFSARDLWHSGIILKKNRANNLLDIKLREGVKVLEIPCLCIDGTTSPLFKNLVAYEQQCSQQPYLTSYIAFLRGLVSSPEDFRLLRKHGMVSYVLGGDDEFTALIHSLAKDILYDRKDCHLLPLIRKVEHLRNIHERTWMRRLQQKYFTMPWSSATLLQAVLVLQLTVIQTLYTILSYNRPNK